MRRLLGIAVRLAVLWSAWWVLAAVGVHLALPRLVGAEPGAEASLVGVGGFPGRFAVDLSGVRLSDPGADWQADRVQITARAWNPVHFDVVLPPEHQLRLGAERLTLTSAANRGELALLPVPALTFRGLVLELDKAAIASNLGWRAAVAGADVDIRPGEADLSFDAVADLTGLVLPPEVQRQIDPAALQPGIVDSLTLDATAAFDRPWNRYTVEVGRPQPTAIQLRGAELVWGDIRISAEGALTLAEGVPDGVIRLRTPDWRAVYDFALASNMIKPEDAGRIETALTILSLGGEALVVPITFQNGIMAVGPVPAGPAPLIRIP